MLEDNFFQWTVLSYKAAESEMEFAGRQQALIS